MDREVWITNEELGVLTDATTVTLADIDDIYGIKELLSGTVVVPAGTATDHPSTGRYQYEIGALDPAKAYVASFKIVRSNGDIEYEEVDIPILSDVVPVITGKSYASAAEGDEYFATRLNSDAWDDSTDANKAKALVTATKIIDRLNFKGEKTDENQTLQFPRYNDLTIPEDIRNACLEIALALLDGVDPEIEFDNLSMVSQNYANVRSTYDRSSPSEHIVAGIPSVSAWRYLQPYIRDTRAVDLSRVS